MTPHTWNYFEKLNKNVAMCKTCKKRYSFKTSITNLKRHLIRKHPDLYQNYLNDIGEVYVLNITNEELSNDSAVIDADAISSSEIIVTVDKPLQEKKPFTQKKLAIFDVQHINEQFLKILIYDYQQISIVESEGFKDFVNALNPNYTLPRQKEISTLLKEQYLQCKNQISILIKDAKKICLTAECWTSTFMDEYVAVSAHFIHNFELKTFLLNCEHFDSSVTSDNLCDFLKNIAVEWNIENKITLAVSDNGANIKSAIQNIGWPSFVCFLIKLNSVIEEAMQYVEHILDRVQKIVRHFEKNTLAAKELLQYQIDNPKNQKALHLVLAIGTKWNDKLYMIERFLQLQTPLEAVISAINLDLPKITVEMWGTLKNICMILKPFDEVTRIMNGTQYLDASLAIVILDGLKDVIAAMKSKNISGAAKNFLQKLEEGLTICFPEDTIEDNLLLGTCAFLDPRFKFFFSDFPMDYHCERTVRANLIKEHILELIKHKIRLKEGKQLSVFVDDSFLSQPSSSSDNKNNDISIWSKIDSGVTAYIINDIDTKAKNELEMYINEDMIHRQSCPLKWWKSHAIIYPNLTEIFSEHCHNVVSCVQCEKVFTKAGCILSNRRNRLSREHIGEIIFLNTNLKYCN